jgi:hypothetical protein
MSIGPAFGIAGGLASTSLAQTKGADGDRSLQETASQSATVEADKKAEAAAGLGEAEAQSESSERDADGRRLWEWPLRQAEEKEQPAPPALSKDASGQRGTQLDLSG